MLALFQTLTGDSWEGILFNCFESEVLRVATIMYVCSFMHVVGGRAQAGWAMTMVFFVAYFIIANYITLNLFIAAILESFAETEALLASIVNIAIVGRRVHT